MLEFDVLKSEEQNVKLYNKSYELWHKIWGSFYLKVERRKLVSDPFLFNDEVCVITNHGEPIAVFLMSFFDKKIKARFNTSYLNQFPPQIVENHIKSNKYNKICLYSNIAVSAEYRKSNKNISLRISRLQGIMALYRFTESNAETMFGYCRNEKGINLLASDHGAKVLAVAKRHSGICDFIAVDKSDMIFDSKDLKVRAKAKELWEQYMIKEHKKLKLVA